VPKLGVFSGEEIVRIMEVEGFVRARQKGSHLMMQRRTDSGTITVPVPPASHCPDRHTAIYHSPIRHFARTLYGVKLLLCNSRQAKAIVARGPPQNCAIRFY
jgi:predicted RNA binding protein YcfA (HicA-like mRNA interferase family)